MPSRNAPKPELTADEIAAVRELIKERDRRVWLYSSARTWAVWIAAVVGGVTIGWDTLAKLARTLVGKG